MLEKVKIWLKENGFVGFAALVVAVVAGVLGFWFVFWGALGFFVGKNWEIIKQLYKENLKAKVDLAVKAVEDKAKAKVDNAMNNLKGKV